MPQELQKFTGFRVLSVEDYLMNQELLRAILEEELHCEVSFACDGLEAVEMHKNGKYDLILMDLTMKGMDGFDTTKALRKLNAPLNKVPIIAVTANTLPEDRAKCAKVGMDDYLPKPVSARDLEKVLKIYLKS